MVKEPMDWRTIRDRIKGGHYTEFASFERDVLLVFDNCTTYNSSPSSEYYTVRAVCVSCACACCTLVCCTCVCIVRACVCCACVMWGLGGFHCRLHVVTS